MDDEKSLFLSGDYMTDLNFLNRYRKNGGEYLDELTHAFLSIYHKDKPREEFGFSEGYL